MAAASLFLARFLGSFILILGVLSIFRHEQLAAFADGLLQDRSTRYSFGLMQLAVGLAVVMAHNVWVWSYELIITLIGWILVFEALWHLTSTGPADEIFLESAENTRYWIIVGLLSMVVGGYLLMKGLRFF